MVTTEVAHLVEYVPIPMAPSPLNTHEMVIFVVNEQPEAFKHHVRSCDPLYENIPGEYPTVVP